ncbi:MAG: glucosamine-6-phosphate deaminase [Acidimicrobiales bacterium]
MVDRPRVVIEATLDTLAAMAAEQAAAVIADAVARNGVAHAMFATGNSQLAFTDALRRRDVPWSDVVAFHMDEYVGVGRDHPASFQRWISQRIPAGTVHYLEGMAPPASECARYAALLQAHPIDLCCLGIGENGHLAFNDPPVADFADPLDVKVVELDRACRMQQVGEGHFPDIDAVPTHAMTVTIPALLRAATVIAVVPEERKAVPVRDAIEGPLTTACPASALRTANATVYLDHASASLLSH